MPSSKNAITGLDIGTDRVRAIIGYKTEDGSLDIIGLGDTKSNGLRKGMVVDIEETITSISKVLEEAERMAGVTSERVYVGIGGSHIKSSNSKGVIAVSRADGEISEEDVERVIEAARAVSVPANQEIIHVIPRIYTVDGQKGIHDPQGMTGVRLEVETHVIYGSTPIIRNLSKCVYQAGLEIAELVLNPLAATQVLLSKQQKEVGVALVDIGSQTTQLAIFEEGDILHSAVLPIGSSYITNDIAIGLRTSIETAEKIKKEFGVATPEDVSDDEEIDIKKIDKEEAPKASKKYVSEIISARLGEIFNHILSELKSVNRDGNLPAGVVFCGGGAKLNNLAKAAKDGLKLPAQIGKPVIEISGLIDKINDPGFATVIGLMSWGAEQSDDSEPKSRQKITSATSKIRGWFKNFLP